MWQSPFLWRTLPRAWQGYPPAGYVLASDWTGRTRELIGWRWPWVRVDVEDTDPPLARRVPAYDDLRQYLEAG